MDNLIKQLIIKKNRKQKKNIFAAYDGFTKEIIGNDDKTISKFKQRDYIFEKI